MLKDLDCVEYDIYGLGFFGIKILPLSFFGRLCGGGIGLCSFIDEDASSASGLFGRGCAELRLGPTAVWSEVGLVGVEEGFCDCGLARTDSTKL